MCWASPAASKGRSGAPRPGELYFSSLQAESQVSAYSIIYRLCLMKLTTVTENTDQNADWGLLVGCLGK